MKLILDIAQFFNNELTFAYKLHAFCIFANANKTGKRLTDPAQWEIITTSDNAFYIAPVGCRELKDIEYRQMCLDALNSFLNSTDIKLTELQEHIIYVLSVKLNNQITTELN